MRGRSALALLLFLAGSAAAANELSDQELYEALGVRIRLEMVLGFKAWCRAEVPASSDTLEPAVAAWLSRNGPQLELSNARIERITDADTLAALSDEDSFNRRIFEDLSTRPPAKKESICRNFPAKLLAPEMDTRNALQFAEELRARHKGGQ